MERKENYRQYNFFLGLIKKKKLDQKQLKIINNLFQYNKADDRIDRNKMGDSTSLNQSLIL